jgi:flagellar biogenesis protein FliO
MEMLQQLAAVALVLGSLCALVWVMKRKGWARVGGAGVGWLRGRSFTPRNSQAQLEVIERLVLTPQHSVHLIRLADRILLVGLSPNGCNLLESTPAAALEQPAMAQPGMGR